MISVYAPISINLGDNCIQNFHLPIYCNTLLFGRKNKNRPNMSAKYSFKFKGFFYKRKYMGAYSLL